MATLNSQLSVIINYVPMYSTGVTAFSNSLNGTNSTWPNGMPDMLNTYSGGWYQAQFLDGAYGFGTIVGTGSDYGTALTNFMIAATSSLYQTPQGAPEHQMRSW